MQRVLRIEADDVGRNAGRSTQLRAQQRASAGTRASVSAQRAGSRARQLRELARSVAVLACELRRAMTTARTPSRVPFVIGRRRKLHPRADRRRGDGSEDWASGAGEIELEKSEQCGDDDRADYGE